MMLTMLAYGCNEKISPKLLEGNQSGTTVPPVIEPEEYYFRIKNTSPTTRKYHLHKSGAGNATKKCEIRSTTKFSSPVFRDPARNAEFDISCFFEAEELSLSRFGFSFDFEASPNTCEYVAYAPFSFYNFQPGDSSGTLEAVKCSTDTTSVANIIAAGETLPQYAGGNVGCGQMVDADIAPGVREAFPSPKEDEALCLYNHAKNKGPNCDIGKIRVIEREYSHTPGENGDPATVSVTTTTRDIDCGGKIGYCADGPFRQESDFKPSDTMGIIYYETVKNEAFTQSRKYEAVDEKWENLYYSNFRRNLANPHIDFEVQTLNLVNYVESFTGMTEIITKTLDNYAAGKLYNNSTDIPGTSPTTVANNTRVTKSYATEAFMGLKDYRVNPFYTFYCLDSALEIRGRIKMMVREWDQAFSTNQATFELITDADQYDNARIDNITDPGEIPDNGDVLNDLNDKKDWDDLILMTRTPGPIDPSATVWEPENGFFSPFNFPQIVIEE